MKQQRTQKIIRPELITAAGTKRRINARQFIAESCEIAKTLAPQKKLLFLMHYDHGYTNREIAEICECSVNKVNQKLMRITKEINAKRKMISEGEETEHGLGRGHGEGQG